MLSAYTSQSNMISSAIVQMIVESAVKCSVEDCNRQVRASGLCETHYMRKWRHGAAETINRPEDWGDFRRDNRYLIWGGIKQRCLNPKNPKYARYGGRGISICADWQRDFRAFCQGVGARPTALHSLDRIDNDKGYEPGNVRWATHQEQQDNRSVTVVGSAERESIIRLLGEGKSSRQISKDLGISYDAVINFRAGVTNRVRSLGDTIRSTMGHGTSSRPANDNQFTKHDGCLVESCHEGHYGLGYCSKHYKQSVAGRDPNQLRTCDECGDAISDDVLAHAKFCGRSCQMKWHRKHGAYTAEALLAKGKVCAIGECGKAIHAHGYCKGHAKRLWSYGDPTFIPESRRGTKLCDYPGCEKKHFALGYCSSHYQTIVPRAKSEISEIKEMCTQYGETPIECANKLIEYLVADNEIFQAEVTRCVVRLIGRQIERGSPT